MNDTPPKLPPNVRRPHNPAPRWLAWLWAALVAIVRRLIARR